MLAIAPGPGPPDRSRAVPSIHSLGSPFPGWAALWLATKWLVNFLSRWARVLVIGSSNESGARGCRHVHAYLVSLAFLSGPNGATFPVAQEARDGVR